MKKIKIVLLLVAILSTPAGVSHASDWVSVGDNENFIVFVDVQSIRMQASEIRVWERWSFFKAQEEKGSSPGRKYKSEKTLSVYDCADKTVRTIEVNRYADQKAATAPIESISHPDDSAYKMKVVPGSIAGKVLEFVCGVKSKQK